jgi:molybdopterin converting factor small subunit
MTLIAASPVTIRVLLFGSYAEALGRETLDLRVSQEAGTIAHAIQQLRALPGGDRLPLKPLCALNLKQAPLDAVLKTGDELALLPPLAGG